MTETAGKTTPKMAAENPLILIVDDSPTIRMSLSRAVQIEFRSIEAGDGEEAWSLLQAEENIELLITDLSMPNLDGFGLIQRIRENVTSEMQNLPIIVVTGADDTDARERAFLAGANDFLTKDSDRVELLARLRAHFKLAQTIRQLEASQRELRERANTDPLTGLTSRRFFKAIAEKELSLMRRQQDYFAVLMIDIDHFKSVTDIYGHPAGDEMLKQVALALAENLREEDTVARIGGEKFVVCSPTTNRLASIVLAERLRKSVESLAVEIEGSRVPVTISLGVVLRPQDGDDLDALLAVANERLSVAKQQGLNRFCVADKKTAGQDDEPVKKMSPHLNEALSMVRHGNVQRVIPHLPELMDEVMPFLDLINAQSSDAPIDVEKFSALAEQLRAKD